MKKTINEIARMQRIAGLITESEYQETLQEENSTPSKELRQAVLKYIKPEYQDKVENTYDRYINFLKAYTKPVTGNDRKEIYPAIVKNLVKAKSIDPSEILNHYRVENLDLLGDLMFKNSDVALSILKKLDGEKINKNKSFIKNTQYITISSDEVEDFGEFDANTNTFEVESGSDAMGDWYGSVSGNDNWFEDEDIADELSPIFHKTLEDAIKNKYGANVDINYY